MTHIVDQILEQFRQRLYDAATLARNNVEVDRDWPIAPEEEPFDWLLINEGADRVTESSMPRPRRLTEEMEVKVRAVSRANLGEGTSKARCRKMMLQVQLALLGPGADITLGRVAKFMRYAGSQPVEDETAQDVAARELSFVVTFQTSEASFEAST